MARIDWVQSRLNNWALWKQREQGGGLGFSASTSFLHEFNGDRYRESRVPVDEVDASVTDQAVESLKLGHGHLHVTLEYIYLQGLGIKETGRLMQRAESTVKAQLERADALLAQWFIERKRRQEAAAITYRGGFTT